jgi:hypothetical protein
MILIRISIIIHPKQITPAYRSDLNLHVVKEHQAMFSTFQEALLRAEIPYTPVNTIG